ncbi:5086_t:CDS:1, partial [Racocetra fulgida]
LSEENVIRMVSVEEVQVKLSFNIKDEIILTDNDLENVLNQMHCEKVYLKVVDGIYVSEPGTVVKDCEVLI